MFRKLNENSQTLTVHIDGQPAKATPGETVAAVILRQPQGWNRTTPVEGRPRAPFCMMGVCFDCLVVVDGQASVQGCLTLVRDGMRIERQHGKRRVM